MTTTEFYNFVCIDDEGIPHLYEDGNPETATRKWVFSYYLGTKHGEIKIFAEINPKVTFKDARNALDMHKSMPAMLRAGQSTGFHKNILSILEKMVKERLRSEISDELTETTA